MNWFATVFFAILEVALRSLRNAYTFVGNSRQIGSELADLGRLATSRARPCLAVALSIVLLFCFTSLVTTVQAADPGHPASSISAGTFESGNYVFPNNLTVMQFLIVDTDTLYVDSIQGRVGIGTNKPSYRFEVASGIDKAVNLSGILYINGTSQRVGIGTASPKQTLDVVGDVNTTGNLIFYGEIMPDGVTCGNNEILKRTGANTWACAIDENSGGNVTGNGESNVVTKWTGQYTLGKSSITDDGNVTVNNSLDVIGADGTSYFFVNQSNGRVGIGTTSPGAKLEVNGATIIDGTTNDALLLPDNKPIRAGSLTTGLWLLSGDSSSGTVTLGSTSSGANLAFNAEGGTKMVINTGGNVGIGATSPSAKLEIQGSGAGGLSLNASNDLFVNDTSGNVGIGTTPQTKLDIHGGGSDNLLNITDGSADVMYINSAGNIGIGNTGPDTKLHVTGGACIDTDDACTDPGAGNLYAQGDIKAAGYLNTTGADVCIEGGTCLSTRGSGNGDVTDVLAGWGITVTNSGGPQPRVNLSNESAGTGLAYSQGVLSVNAGNGLGTSGDDVIVNEGEGVSITSDVLHFDCSEVTDTANDGIGCSNENLFVGAGNGLTANDTALEIDLYPGSGLISDGIGLSMNRSCSNGQLMKWDSSLSRWYCANDSGLSSESDTLDTVADRGATTDKALTIDSNGDEQTSIGGNLTVDSGTLFVDKDTNSVGIGTTGPDSLFEVYGGNVSIQRSDNAASSNILFQNSGGWYNWRLTNEGGDGTDDFTIAGGDSGASPTDLTPRITIKSTGNVGIGDTGPDARLEVLSSSGPQLMLTNTDNVDYANFTVDSDGNLTITPSGGNVIIRLG